jgi:hypothetical protein
MESKVEVQTLALAGIAAVSTIAIVYGALHRQGKSQSATCKGSPPPVFKTGLPIIGPFMKFASDPLSTVKAGRKACGDIFTMRLVTEKITVLIGPTPHAAFFNAMDEDMDQAEPYKFMTPIFGPGVGKLLGLIISNSRDV